MINTKYLSIIFKNTIAFKYGTNRVFRTTLLFTLTSFNIGFECVTRSCAHPYNGHLCIVRDEVLLASHHQLAIYTWQFSHVEVRNYEEHTTGIGGYYCSNCLLRENIRVVLCCLYVRIFHWMCLPPFFIYLHIQYGQFQLVWRSMHEQYFLLRL